MNPRDSLEQVVNSNPFQNYCYGNHCPMKAEGCRHYCPIFALRIYLTANTP